MGAIPYQPKDIDESRELEAARAPHFSWRLA